MINILLIEDNKGDQILFTESLKGMSNVSTDICGDMNAAKKKLANTHYDVIFTDLNLPFINSQDVVDTINKATNEQTPIVVVTGVVDKLQKGVDTLLKISINEDTVPKIILNSLNKAKRESLEARHD